jgi:hypothetical protein
MLALRCFLVALLTALALTATGEGRRRTVRAPETGLEIHPLAGYDPTLAITSDLEPFRALVGDARVVALGESWHTSGGFYLMKHRLFRFLVEEMGFRAFAIESNWDAVEQMNAYVRTCTGSAEDAIRPSTRSGRAPSTRTWRAGCASGIARTAIPPIGWSRSDSTSSNRSATGRRWRRCWGSSACR